MKQAGGTEFRLVEVIRKLLPLCFFHSFQAFLGVLWIGLCLALLGYYSYYYTQWHEGIVKGHKGSKIVFEEISKTAR